MAGVFLFLCSGSNRSCSIISVYDNEAFGDKENIINSDFNTSLNPWKDIEDKDYIAKLKQDGMRNFIKYGVACYKKDCKVMIYEE